MFHIIGIDRDKFTWPWLYIETCMCDNENVFFHLNKHIYKEVIMVSTVNCFALLTGRSTSKQLVMGKVQELDKKGSIML